MGVAEVMTTAGKVRHARHALPLRVAAGAKGPRLPGLGEMSKEHRVQNMQGPQKDQAFSAQWLPEGSLFLYTDGFLVSWGGPSSRILDGFI